MAAGKTLVHARLRRLSSAVLLCLGAGLLLFAIAAYGWMSWQQRQLTAQWSAQNLAGAGATLSSVQEHTSSVTLLLIPKIGLQAAVLDGADDRSLLVAPGHLPNTAWPGDPGNAVIAGHRDTFFHRIDDLTSGDEIQIRRGGHEYRYVVSEKSIVAPTDVAVTRRTADTRLTLITCYPTYYIGPAPKRLIIVAQLQSPPAP